jgi:cation diffusion facilitator family transporter
MMFKEPELPSPQIHQIHRLNVAVNLIMATVKVSIGLAAGSGALVADGLNSTSDIFSNAVAWIGYKLSLRPPDEDHHYGHGNFEPAAAALIGGIILAAGLAIIWRAFSGVDLTASGGLGWAALAAALLSVVISAWLGRVTLKVGREHHSPSLVALGRDKISDAFSSGLAMVGIAGSLSGLTWVEPPATVLVGLWICVLGVHSISDGADVLMDRVSDPKLRGELEAKAKGVSGVECVRDVRVHPLGATYSADLTICVEGTISVSAGHDIAGEVERAITDSIERVAQVVVHVEPS